MRYTGEAQQWKLNPSRNSSKLCCRCLMQIGNAFSFLREWLHFSACNSSSCCRFGEGKGLICWVKHYGKHCFNQLTFFTFLEFGFIKVLGFYWCFFSIPLQDWKTHLFAAHSQSNALHCQFTSVQRMCQPAILSI